ncbi:MAG: Chorismate synthase [Chlamydiia bacterium]|nr:Chorismate synthase [Chlamydiia bacterium]MCH9615637.1 Chorismate synthase [Chlamydiia bacterium]MCH9628960.1 Chorismate synthase [Chlamydiia bacterium]
MGSNRFGKCFEITTWGESHGKGLGVVIDGCPPNLEITDEEINRELRLRRPGQNPYTSPRGEKDEAAIYSGVFEGKTTGAPISIVIHNADADSSKYEPIKDLLRPGHANFTYLKKYGIFDYRGGGRSSARETAARVAAGAIARKVIPNVEICAYIKEIAGVEIGPLDHSNLRKLKEDTCESPIFCPDKDASEKMMAKILEAKEAGDSVGGIIECVVNNVPVGLGDPVYDKLEANLAKAMLSIPATKGFEIGSGFAAARMKGSEHNDPFINDNGVIRTKTNHGGGTLGGISDGMTLIFRVAFKPTSSIEIPQETVNLKGEPATFKLPEGSRHDPCVTVRAAPIVEAMTAITLADAYLANEQLPHTH